MQGLPVAKTATSLAKFGCAGHDRADGAGQGRTQPGCFLSIKVVRDRRQPPGQPTYGRATTLACCAWQVWLSEGLRGSGSQDAWQERPDHQMQPGAQVQTPPRISPSRSGGRESQSLDAQLRSSGTRCHTFLEM